MKSAGKVERVSISLLGTDVEYHSKTGEVFLDNTVVSKGPRFGSYDTVGLGFHPPGTVFWTWNGHPIDFIENVTPGEELRPNIKLKGKGTHIIVSLEGWKAPLPIMPSELIYNSSLLAYAEKQLSPILIPIFNMCLKYNIENER